ncbi:aldo/keto reductase [Denitratisoma oestradiolicum]|uniref:Aldo/keto reductase n=1 Tax=Denitratisoma oestradiolicum TaxID=311182 RepID=A0A6S6Y3A0_9PROT|nr:aldo/keto reductase [Denitratisoma oestradiolicum]TWO79947.1 aldo/keto reductase [Denitratisoma oestradiolicum]CAB1369706.1 Aldo/keto reductase [Denitratisoma oestradiolicum]
MLKKLSLANTDLSVSQLCLGTNMFGTAQPLDKAGEILDTFFAGGGNFIDTAHSYGDWIPDIPNAASERTLGELLKGKPRADYVLATKGCEFDYRKGDYALRVTPALLESDLMGSLALLGVDFIDLYWLHRDDPSCPVREIVDALIDHQQAGHIRYFGCSNWSVDRILEAQQYAASLGHVGFVACQPMWGLAEPDRTAMMSYAPGGYYEDGYQVLHQAGMTMIPYSGQSRGIFSKLAAGMAREAISPDVAALYYSDVNLRKVDVLKTIAARRGASVNDIVLAYLTSQTWATVPIIGCSSVVQLRESIDACAIRLDTEELRQLKGA